jgi:hypothetical protein
MRGRGAGASAAQDAAVLSAVAALEADGGLASPVDSALIEGEWRLLYTSKSAFDARNPLGARVDGSSPGLEGLFRAIFGVRCGHSRTHARTCTPPRVVSVRSRACMCAQASAGKTLAAGAAAASSSPIQRTITGNDAFTVLQTVRLRGDDPRVDQARALCALTLRAACTACLRACLRMTHAHASLTRHSHRGFFQVVRFGSVGELRLSAGASTPAPSRRRIDFAFESGFFDFKAFPLRIPCALASRRAHLRHWRTHSSGCLLMHALCVLCVHPCACVWLQTLCRSSCWATKPRGAKGPPLRCSQAHTRPMQHARSNPSPLTHARAAPRRSWLDTSYLSERVRISKGNKGTTFILCRYEGDDAAV